MKIYTYIHPPAAAVVVVVERKFNSKHIPQMWTKTACTHVYNIANNISYQVDKELALKNRNSITRISSTYNGNFNQKPRHIKYHNIL